MTSDLSRHLYLEKVEGKKALATVRHWNERTLDTLESDPRYSDLYSRALDLANSDDRIPVPSIGAGMVYNFWQDETNVRGLWRRTSFDQYVKKSPRWEILLDVDALAEEENRNWVFKSVSCLPDRSRCMVALSNGGKDAAVWREFDLNEKRFVPDGFNIAEAKSTLVWANRDALLISTDWGQDSLTESGYPYIIKLLGRGQTFARAEEIMRGQKSDVGVFPVAFDLADGSRLFGAAEADTFFSSTHWALGWARGESSHFASPPLRLNLPPRASVHGVFSAWMLVSLRQDFTAPDGKEFVSGDLIALAVNADGTPASAAVSSLVFRPTHRQALAQVGITRHGVLIDINDNVNGKILLATPGDDRLWKRAQLDLPDNGSTNIVSTDSTDHRAFIGYDGYLTPDTVYLIESETKLTRIKQLPDQFDSAPYAVEQFEAISSDGQAIPYTLVSPANARGPLPLLLYGYGGFQISLTPSYSPFVGRLWLELGGAYVVANTRGGGEFGPKWHQAGLKTRRQIIYDDFIAVAEDLIARGITSPRHLGISGASNGGLLTGVMYTQRPDLWNAVISQVPLLDMLRYHKLLAGASWVDEYGSPDIPQERAWLEKMSPYHNVDPLADHPPMLLMTSTKDDRVHPGHARKMAKLLEELGKPFLYYENIDGGHSAAANRIERAKRNALAFTFLAHRLIGDSGQ